MKSYLLVLPISMAIVACVPQGTNTQTPMVIPASQANNLPKPPSTKPSAAKARAHLHEIQVDTDLSTVGAPIDWIQIFSAISFKTASNAHNLGFSHRVASFSTVAELKADSLAHLKLISAVPARQKTSVAEEMVKRASSQMDFNSKDLIAVYLTEGGPPFGEYRYSMVGDTMEFCINKAPHSSGISGMALKTLVKFYAAPKGLKVKMCGR